MNSSSNHQQGPWRKMPTMPVLFFLALLLGSAVWLSPANAWFAASIPANRQWDPVAVDAVSADHGTSLSMNGVEEMRLTADDAEGLYAAIDAMDFAAAEDQLAALSRERQGDLAAGAKGQALVIRYTVSREHNGDGHPGVYLRFAANHGMGNLVTVNGSPRECVQALLYVGPDGELVPMPRLSLRGQGTHYYCPLPLRGGEQIELEYLLFFPAGLGDDTLDEEGLLQLETIQARNNASVFWWNVVFQGGDVTPFDRGDRMDTPYAAYALENAPPEQDDEELPLPEAGEADAGNDGDQAPPDDSAETPPEDAGEEPTSSADGEDEQFPNGNGEERADGGEADRGSSDTADAPTDQETV